MIGGMMTFYGVAVAQKAMLACTSRFFRRFYFFRSPRRFIPSPFADMTALHVDS